MQRAFDASGASDSNEGLGKLENCGGGGGGGVGGCMACLPSGVEALRVASTAESFAASFLR